MADISSIVPTLSSGTQAVSQAIPLKIKVCGILFGLVVLVFFVILGQLVQEKYDNYRRKRDVMEMVESGEEFDPEEYKIQPLKRNYQTWIWLCGGMLIVDGILFLALP